MQGGFMRLVADYSLMQNPANICPPEIFGQVVAVPIRFTVFLGDPSKKATETIEQEGIIEVHRDLAADVAALFAFMMTERFPLSCVRPIASFEWDDERSMAANNTSGFNYRMIAGTERLSYHAYGRAIDINPLLNPSIQGGVVRPRGAAYDPSLPGTLTADSPVTQFLKQRGWMWGGDWTSLKDYQHFEKLI